MNCTSGLRKFACVALVGMATLTFAQSVSNVDKKFVKEALEGGNAEINLGKLAQQKGKSDEVKQFGQKMVADHTRMAEHMREVAQKIGVNPPTGTSMSDKALYEKLNLFSGDDFDKAYVKAMIKDHQDDLNAFQQEETNGTSMSVKKAAKDGAETISSHLELIKKIAADHQIALM